MGKLVDLKDLPAVTRTGVYDNEIKDALSMPTDKALQVSCPVDTKLESCNLAIRDRIKKLGYDDKMHARKIGDAVYLLHGASPYVKAKGRGKRGST